MYQSLFQAVMNLAVPLGLCILFLVITLNFLIYEDEKERRFIKSKVETFSMTGFMIILYILIMLKVGSYEMTSITRILGILGLIIFYFGLGFNIVGRVYLGKNWSNHVRIRQEHQMIQSGPFKLVRHPLYASIIWMIYGSGLIYHNYLVLLLNTAIFIPIMVYRSNQEEHALIETFSEYKAYRKKTGRFLIKIGRKNETY